MPEAVLTPKGLEAALAEYVTFPSLPVDAFASTERDAPVERADSAASAGAARADCLGRE